MNKVGILTHVLVVAFLFLAHAALEKFHYEHCKTNLIKKLMFRDSGMCKVLQLGIDRVEDVSKTLLVLYLPWMSGIFK